MDDSKKKKNITSKVYFEGDWQKDQDALWAFFDKGQEEHEKEKEKTEEIEKEEPPVEEEILLEEKDPEEAQDIPVVSKEVVSITDLGRTSSDPRYNRNSIISKDTEKPEVPPPKVSIPESPSNIPILGNDNDKLMELLIDRLIDKLDINQLHQKLSSKIAIETKKSEELKSTHAKEDIPDKNIYKTQKLPTPAHKEITPKIALESRKTSGLLPTPVISPAERIANYEAYKTKELIPIPAIEPSVKKPETDTKAPVKEEQGPSLSDIMLRYQKKQMEDTRKKENLKKIRGVIFDLGSHGFSFYSLIFNRETYINESNFKKMGTILKYDPTIALRILQLANSAYYGRQKKKFNIMESLNILGIDKVKHILEMASGFKLFRGPKKIDFFKQVWYHSIGTGLFCKLLAREKDLNEDELFMLGMMHDLGKIILFISIPEQYEEVLKIVKENPILLRNAEKDYLGYDHCEIGHMALETWELPEQLINAAKYHHNIDQVQNLDVLRQLAIVQASDVMCNLAKIGSIGAKRTELFDKKTKSLVGKIDTQNIMNMVKSELKTIEELLKDET